MAKSALTIPELDAAIERYCAEHHIPLQSAGSRWFGRRHPQLVRLCTARHLVAVGRADLIPPELLHGPELPRLTTDERYRRASARRRELGGPVYDR